MLETMKVHTVGRKGCRRRTIRSETRDIRRACTRNRVVRDHIRGAAVIIIIWRVSVYFIRFRYNLRGPYFTRRYYLLYRVVRGIPITTLERQKIKTEALRNNIIIIILCCKICMCIIRLKYYWPCRTYMYYKTL